MVCWQQYSNCARRMERSINHRAKLLVG